MTSLPWLNHLIIVPVLLPRYVLSTLGARPATGLRLLAMLRTEVRERIFMP